jgi:hypothetical protein
MRETEWRLIGVSVDSSNLLSTKQNHADYNAGKMSQICISYGAISWEESQLICSRVRVEDSELEVYSLLQAVL